MAGKQVSMKFSHMRHYWVLVVMVLAVLLMLVTPASVHAATPPFGAMYQPNEHPDEHRWAKRAEIARIFDSNTLSVWNDYPGARRAYADGIRKFVFSWKMETTNAQIRNFADSLPNGVRVFGVLEHEPEAKIARGDYTLAEWKARTVEQAAVQKDVGMVPTTILMGWTLYPEFSGRDVSDYDLPPGTIRVHAFDAHVRGNKEPDVMARRIRIEQRRTGLPTGVGETSGSPAHLKTFREGMLRAKKLRWVISFTQNPAQTDSNTRWTGRHQRAFYRGLL